MCPNCAYSSLCFQLLHAIYYICEFRCVCQKINDAMDGYDDNQVTTPYQKSFILNYMTDNLVEILVILYATTQWFETLIRDVQVVDLTSNHITVVLEPCLVWFELLIRDLFWCLMCRGQMEIDLTSNHISA